MTRSKAVQAMLRPVASETTRTDLVALFVRYNNAESARSIAGYQRFTNAATSAEYKAAADAALAAHQAMLDGILALDIPA
ncbi:hypothetical protein E3T43_07330 [Cryobacterium sp. Hh7]|uniref:hypothetical protein n=1 Tax=Cryobacterium sp. Hh7 TaxID=1259159 RepID=UPI00106C5090|nr:hypothetical protein [Cryobacterium sp. Hh7]TFD58050.1 hypothetical protein E3T43_07330 [Cryobacterium sp. Hh7]